MKASDPHWRAINLIQTALCVAMNPHMHTIEVCHEDMYMMPVYIEYALDELAELLEIVDRDRFFGIG